MNKDHNIHTREIFKEAYEGRTWHYYRDMVAGCIMLGEPGLWLDLGAGCGFFVECANRFGINCIGLEGSPYAVSKANNRYPKMDMRQHFLDDPLPFENSSVSTILCNQVIEHITQPTAVYMLSECYRVLKNKGVIFIYSPCKYNHAQKIERTHINLYAPTSLKREVESIGFHVTSAPNQPKNIFGNSRIGGFLARLTYHLFPSDYLSDSANLIAVK